MQQRGRDTDQSVFDLSPALCRSMPEAFAVSRDHANNMWTFNLDCMDAVVARLKAASASLTIMGVPPWVQKAFRPGTGQPRLVLVQSLLRAASYPVQGQSSRLSRPCTSPDSCKM